jgi:hypothetical protein
MSEADDLIVSSLALPELANKSIVVLLSELIRTVEATIEGIKDYSTGTRYIAPVIDRLTRSLENTIKNRLLVASKNLKVAGSLRGAVHLKSKLKLVTLLEGTKVISELLSISMLSKLRCNRILVLTSTVTETRSTSTCLSLRNILGANLLTVEVINSVAYIKSRNITERLKATKREEEAIRLFTSELDSGYVTLIRVHIAADVITLCVLLTEQVISLCKLYRQLTASREVNTDLILRIGEINTDSITEHSCKL